MLINKVEIRKLALPLINEFNISSGKVRHKEAVIIKLFSGGGLIGFGETTSFQIPVFTNETTEDVLQVIENVISPRVIGIDFSSPEHFIASYSDVSGHLSAKNGVECAFWHLFTQFNNISLKTAFGGVKGEIPVGESIGLKDSLEETLDEVELRLSEGYRRIKLKIRPGWDINLLKIVRHKWAEIDLSVDANTAYTLSEHEEILVSLDNFNLQMIEQPFAAASLLEHAELQKKIKTPICLDESVQTMEDLKLAINIKALRVLNIKPVRVGGIIESIKMHDYAAQNGIGVWCGGMLETGIGRAFNIALASKSNFIFPADMSPYDIFYTEDLIEPSYVVKPDGLIDVSNQPGLGYNIREDVIEKYTVYKSEIV